MMAMALLAFAGFLRFDELFNLKLKDVVSYATYFELFIEVVRLINIVKAPSFQSLKPVPTFIPRLII